MSVKFPLFDTSGQPYALCGLSTDITYRKAAQEALKKYNAELEQFAYIAAHDLQEPLRTVKSYAQWLERRYATAFDEEGREFLGYIVAGADRMNLLVKDLQSYTEIAHRQTTQRTLCDLNQALRLTLQNMHASITESKAEIVAEDLPTVVANARQMGQLLQNLLSNAIKYSGPDEPRINLSVARDEHEWLIRVRDNGIGIDPRYAKQIFGVFKRLHGQDVPGTGVGLAICKQIVEQHGGRIWLESEEGSGATFTFTLPAL
jgi:light-regulated signal transduction histidine kinase (bacteriophytochrome)